MSKCRSLAEVGRSVANIALFDVGDPNIDVVVAASGLVQFWPNLVQLRPRSAIVISKTALLDRSRAKVGRPRRH